jgi:hypothetical protein
MMLLGRHLRNMRSRSDAQVAECCDHQLNGETCLQREKHSAEHLQD